MRPKPQKTPPATTPKPTSKKHQIITLLEGPDGVSLQQLQDVTGWQPHSVRGALVHLKNKDKLPVTNSLVNGTRRYRIMPSQVAHAE